MLLNLSYTITYKMTRYGAIVQTSSKVNGYTFNLIVLRMAKTLWSFYRSECSRVKVNYSAIFMFASLFSWGLLKGKKIAPLEQIYSRASIG